MKHYTILTLMLVFALALSCENPDLDPNETQEQKGNIENTGSENDNKPSEGETEQVKSMTIILDRVSATKAVFKGTAMKTAPDLKIGVYYSETSGESIYDCQHISVYDVSLGDGFELQIDELKPNTTYYYYTYIQANSLVEYDEEQSFTTKDCSLIINKVYNIGHCAIFDGYVDTNNGGIIYSTDSQIDINNNCGKITFNERWDESFSCVTEQLSYDTEYFYCYYLYKDGVYYYSKIESFITDSDKYAGATCNLSLLSAKDLSLNGTANCYIVSEPGLYKLKTVVGKNQEREISGIHSAHIVWETFGNNVMPSKLDLIQGICYKNGYVIFQTSDTFKKGNALISVTDSDNLTLHTWHIWFTDPPRDQIYFNNAGKLLDRNIGATSATVGTVAALGFVYSGGSIMPKFSSSSIDKFEPVLATGTNPEMKYGYSGDGWGSPNSVSDPCPVGYIVPKAEFYRTAMGGDSVKYTYDDVNRGVNFSGIMGSDASIWYPGVGDYSTAGEGGIGKHVLYWLSSRNSSGYRECFYYNRIDWFSYGTFAIRCQKIE